MVSIKLDESKLNSFIEEYNAYSLDNDNEYVYFFAKKDDLVITLYKSKKGYKAVFNGKDDLSEAQKWDILAETIKPKAKISAEWKCYDDQIGSDEVGVGDFLLPLIVVAAYTKKEDIDFLIDLGVKDSKKLKDKDILELVPKFINIVKYSKMTLPNSKYNEIISKGENLNSIKAKMHNQALLNLYKKYGVKNIFIDEFAKKQTYFKYLTNEKEICSNLIFQTKGESYYPSIAVASLIARYAFLIEKQKLEEKYEVKIPFGASKKVDTFSYEFIQKFGLEEFDKIAKKNFANYREVIKLF